MTAEQAPSFEAHVADLRRAFDEAFASPARAAETDGALFLAIRAGGGRFAVRLADLVGVHECRKIVPLPGSAEAVAGLAGIRGRLYAVHVLSALLGIAAPDERIRWLLVAGGDAPIALGVAAIEACLEVAPEELRPAEGGEAHSEHVQEILVRDGVARGVLSLPPLLALAVQRAEQPSGGRR